MNTYLKLSSTKSNTNCNCISPFYIDDISGVNPNTGHYYTDDDIDILKTSLYRISNAKGCDVSVCCDPNDPTKSPDPEFTNKILQKYPKILPTYNGSQIVSIKLSTTPNVQSNGWITPTTHMICKISKATISDTSDPTIKIATNLVQDCFTTQCSQAETITMDNLLQNAKSDMKYTFIDDARVTQAISENDISYVKEYIRKYKKVDSPLTNNNYSNCMIHIASQSNSSNILNMLISLKANLNVTNTLNETPIHFAVRSKNLDNINALLLQGVDLTIATTKGETPMFYAMLSGDIRVINMLYNNASPILNVDNLGNNLIHYCVLNCPSFKDVDDDTKNASNSITNRKVDIIRFLIEHGVNSEQLNLDGVSPLELTGQLIKKEMNRESVLSVSSENSKINESFFNIKPIITKNSFMPKIEKFSNNNSVTKNDVSCYNTEHQSLLEIQSMLFNNIVKNNPNKYGGYISTDDVPKGAPIEILDTVCYGDGMTGNEDSKECVAKGGQIVKIRNKTTKIKIELTPDNDVDIDSVDDSDLYFSKNPEKIPKTNYPKTVQDYNSEFQTDSKFNTIPNTTVGITYNLGQESSNELNCSKPMKGFNPQPTRNPAITSLINSSPTNIQSDTSKTPPPPSTPPTPSTPSTQTLDHPPDYDDSVIHKYQSDAISNSTQITKSQTTQPQTTLGNISASSLFEKYKTVFIILFVIIGLLILGILGYIFILNRNTSSS
jgi:hypothetical protein